jgi:hypothetical protein
METLFGKECSLMSTLQAALYARVSSEQQAEANTIASQVTALREPLSPMAFPCHKP